MNYKPERLLKTYFSNVRFGGTAGQYLLLVHEDRGDGFYSADLHQVIAEHAQDLGFFIQLYPIAFDPDVIAIPDRLIRLFL